jgi:hypothetical protein
MIEIDLLKFFDKSFSEIDEILHRKEDVSEVIDEKEELTSIIKQRRKKTYIFTYLTIAALIVVIGFTGFKFYELIKYNLVTLPPEKVKNDKEQISTSNKPRETTPDVNLVPEYTVKGEDIVIGTIEFVGENLPAISLNDTNHVKKPEIPKITKNDNIDLQNKEHPKSTQIETTYSVKLYYVDPQMLDNIKRKIQSYPDKQIKILGKNSEIKTIWNLYKPTKGTNKFIGSREVAFIKSFTSKEEAIRFAKTKNIPAIIVKKSRNIISYDLIISNFSDKQEASEFVSSFNINRKHIRIQENI